MRAVKTKLNSLDTKAVKAVISGTVIAVISSIVVTVIISFIITLLGKLPENSLEYISLAILGIGSLIGGYIAGRINKSSALIIGILTGIFILVIVLFAGINTISNGFEVLSLFKLIIILLFSITGAVTGVNKKQKFKYK